jgi:FHA domain
MNRSGGSDDDQTQLVPRSNVGGDTDKTVIPNRPGLDGQRGQVIGTDVQKQVRVAGQQPRNQAPGGQGETVFLRTQPGGAPGTPPFDPVVGWLAVVKGPGRGQFKPVFYGQNTIGRGADQRIPLDFGDQRISRETHAFIIYDEVQRRFFLRDNGKSNLVRHKGNLVIIPTEIEDRDEIVVGDTTLLFVALCNNAFDWLADDEPAKA